MLTAADILRSALDLVIAGGAGRTGRGGGGPGGVLRPEYRDPIQAVTDRYWTEHSEDIAHETCTKRAYGIRDIARRETVGRPWVESDAEQVRVYQAAVAMAERDVAPPEETKEQRLARLEAQGFIVKGCPYCHEFYDHPTGKPAAPSHRASTSCESGKRPHCTCDACW